MPESPAWVPVDPLPDVNFGEPGVGEIDVMTAKHGHVSVHWKKGDAKSVTEAREAFEALQAKGYAIFAIEKARLGDERTVKLEKGATLQGLTVSQASIVAELDPDVVDARPVSKFEEAPKQLVARPRMAGG